MGKYGKRNHKRCFHFDDDGKSINGGCPRGDTCFFVHPEDSDWDEAYPSRHGPAARERRHQDAEDYGHSHRRRDSRDDLRSPVSPAKSRDSGWDGYRDQRRSHSRSRSRSSRSRDRDRDGERGRPGRDSIASSAAASSPPRRGTPPPPARSASLNVDTRPSSDSTRDPRLAAARQHSTSSLSSNVPPPAPSTPSVPYNPPVRVKQESPIEPRLNSLWASTIIDMTADDDAPLSTVTAAGRAATNTPALTTAAPTGLKALRDAWKPRNPEPSTSNAAAGPSASVPTTPITPAPPFKSPRPPGFDPPPQPPPPPPPGFAPIDPPTPLPVFLESMTLETAPPNPKEEIDNETKMALWDERTKILADAVQAREKVNALEEEYKSALQVTESRFFTSLTQEHKDRLTAELTTLLAQRDDARRALEETKLKLIEKSDTWPVMPPPQTAEEAKDQEEKKKGFDEVARFVRELHDYATQMKKMLGDLMGMRGPPPAPPFILGGAAAEEGAGAGDEEGEEGELMDIDMTDGATAGDGDGDDGLHSNRAITRKRKRRRVDSDLEGASQGMVETTAAYEDEPRLSQEEMESLLEKLITLESTAHTLQNDLIAHDNDLREEIEASLETRFEELQVTFSESRDEQEQRWKEEKERVEEKMEEAKKEIGDVGEEVKELGGEIGEMLLKVGEVEREVEAKRREREESYMRVLEIEQRMNAYTALQESNSAKIKTLEIALKAYTTRPPSPPASPVYPLGTVAGPTPSPSYILHVLQDQLTEALRSAMTPLGEEVRQDVERIVAERNKELFATTWNAIKRTMVVVEMIKKRVSAGAGGEGVAQVLAAGAAATPGQAGGAPVAQR